MSESSGSARDQGTRRPRSYGRRRAAVLATVYVLIALHILHWKLAGKTLSPLELNEVMHTLELGIVTAGFVFMCLAALSAAIFGRFFCSWGCHILALEDLCFWLLEKVRMRPRPVRSRVLLWVAPGAMFYMFLWPQVSRILSGQPPPQLRFHSEAEGWASFATTDFWRNLPGPWITVLTLAVCGFAIVYFLGSRGFCTYACPYGVIFGLVDRVAPGRIRLVGDCTQCGICTANCQSHVRVHEEVARFGRVVDSSCLKDLDCVTGCPENALDFGFARPAFLQSLGRARRGQVRYDWSAGEEALMAMTFLAALFIFRGLYDAVPFLMSLGLGCILAYLAAVCVRLARRQNVRLGRHWLKRRSRITPGGRVFALAAALAAVFVAHSAVIRFHERAGQRALETLEAGSASGAAAAPELVTQARHHLETVEHWGLVRSTRLLQRLASVRTLAGSPAAAEPYLRRVLLREPGFLRTRLSLGRVLLSQQRSAAARRELLRLTAGPAPEYRGDRRIRAAGHDLLARMHFAGGDREAALREYGLALEEDPESADAHLGRGTLLADSGRLEEAATHLEAAHRLRPESAPILYNLGVILVQLGLEVEAIEVYRAAVRLAPDDPEARNNLGYLLLGRSQPEAAEPQFRRAIEARPDFAPAHFNLGRLLLATGRSAEGEEHLKRAASLDETYVEVLATLGITSSRGSHRPR
ncbi:MAG: tetratricopeptide repeat protein [bacterium]|nr:tetratricopeptide repeat protein [bacterium]